MFSVTCATPSKANLRNLGAETGATSVIARFSVVKTSDNSPLASTNFTFYDCHQFTNCTACANSKFPCDWCTISNKCVPNAEDVCQGEALVNAISVSNSASERLADWYSSSAKVLHRVAVRNTARGSSLTAISTCLRDEIGKSPFEHTTSRSQCRTSSVNTPSTKARTNGQQHDVATP